MKNIYDINMGFSYVEVHSKPRETESKKQSSLKYGLTIIGGFFACCMAIIIAI